MTALSCRCAFCTVAFAGLATAFLLLPAGAQTRGGTLTIGIDQQVVGFDPVVTKTTAFQTVMVGGMIFGTPLGLDATNHEYPSNAFSVTPSPDGVVWRTKLRPDLTFLRRLGVDRRRCREALDAHFGSRAEQILYRLCFSVQGSGRHGPTHD